MTLIVLVFVWGRGWTLQFIRSTSTFSWLWLHMTLLFFLVMSDISYPPLSFLLSFLRPYFPPRPLTTTISDFKDQPMYNTYKIPSKQYKSI